MDTHVVYCLFWVGCVANQYSTGYILPKVHFKLNNEQGDCENYTANNCRMKQTVVCISVFSRLISHAIVNLVLFASEDRHNQEGLQRSYCNHGNHIGHIHTVQNLAI